jgi:hypothetical protein
MYKIITAAYIGICDQYEHEEQFTNLSELLDSLEHWIRNKSGQLEEAFSALECAWSEAGDTMEERGNYAACCDIYPDDAGLGNIIFGAYYDKNDEPFFELAFSCNDADKKAISYINLCETKNLANEDARLVEYFLDQWNDFAIFFSKPSIAM